MKLQAFILYFYFFKTFFFSENTFKISEKIDNSFSCLKKANSNINLGKWTISNKLGPPNTFDMNNCKNTCLIQQSSQTLLGPFSNLYILERIFSIPEPHYQIKITGEILKCDDGVNSLDYSGDSIKLIIDGINVVKLSSSQKSEKFGFFIPHSSPSFHLQIFPDIQSNISLKMIGLQNIEITVYTNTFILSSSKCICPADYQPINNECIVCSSISGMIYVAKTKQCEEQCGIGQTISSQKLCDDGNIINGDGCSSNCTIEKNYTCRRSPTHQKDSCYLSTPIQFIIQEGDSFNSQNPQYKIIFNRDILDITGDLHDVFKVEIQNTQANMYNYKWEKKKQDTYLLTIDWYTSIVNRDMTITISQPNKIKDSNSISILVTQHSISLQNFYYVSSEDMVLAETLQILSRVIQILQITSIPIFLVTNRYHAVMNAVDMNQIVTYLPLINIRYPGNLKIFFKAFQDFDFNFFPNLFSFLIPSDLTKYQFSYERFIENDIKTSFYIKNAGSNLSIWVIFLIIYAIFKLGASQINKMEKLRLFCYDIVERKFQWLWFIDMMWLLGMNIMICCFLQLSSSISVSSPQEVINIIIVILCLVSFFLAFPLRCYQILIRNTFIQNQTQYGHLWSGLKSNELKSCFFHLVYYIRKMVFAYTITTLYNQTQVQINTLNFFSIFTLLFLLIKNPFKKYKHNIKVFLSELLLFIAQIEMIELKNNIDSPESSRIQTGWVILFAFLGVLILQAIFTLYQAYIAIKKWWQRRKERKNTLRKSFPVKKPSTKIEKQVQIKEFHEKLKWNENGEEDSNNLSYFNNQRYDRKNKMEHQFNFNDIKDDVKDDSNSSISLPEFQRNVRKQNPQPPPDPSSRRTIFIYKNTEFFDEGNFDF